MEVLIKWLVCQIHEAKLVFVVKTLQDKNVSFTEISIFITFVTVCIAEIPPTYKIMMRT